MIQNAGESSVSPDLGVNQRDKAIVPSAESSQSRIDRKADESASVTNDEASESGSVNAVEDIGPADDERRGKVSQPLCSFHLCFSIPGPQKLISQGSERMVSN